MKLQALSCPQQEEPSLLSSLLGDLVPYFAPGSNTEGSEEVAVEMEETKQDAEIGDPAEDVRTNQIPGIRRIGIAVEPGHRDRSVQPVP